MKDFAIEHLEKRLSVLQEKYSSLLPTLKFLALNPKYDNGSNAREKIRLEHQIAELEQLIAEKKEKEV